MATSAIKFVKIEKTQETVKALFHKTGTVMFDLKRKTKTITGSILVNKYFGGVEQHSFAVLISHLSNDFALNNVDDLNELYNMARGNAADRGLRLFYEMTNPITEELFIDWINKN